MLATGFTPVVDDTFDAMTYGSRSGIFADVTGQSLPGNLAYALGYNPTDLRLTVMALNGAPVCTGISLTTPEDTPGDTAPDCSDPDGDTLTFDVTQPAHGTATVVDDQLHYVPAADYNGPDTFTYTASDASLTSDAATVTVTVTPVNDAPVCVDGNATTPEDTAFSDSLAGLCSDVNGDTLTFAVGTGPIHGALELAADGSFTYTPKPDRIGYDSFTFTASDGTIGANVATSTIDVSPTGLVAKWPGNGSSVDVIGHRDAVLENGATYGAGLIGQAFSLDGVDDFVDVADDPALNFGTSRLHRQPVGQLQLARRRTGPDREVHRDRGPGNARRLDPCEARR